MSENQNHSDAYLQTALTAARSAGAILMEGVGSDHIIRYKTNHGDLVTEIDKRAEAEIVGIINRAFPEHSVVAEEGSGDGGNGRYQWCIDPIDGTTNYAHGFPMFCTSIGLFVDGWPEVGVVYAPALNELFVASTGQGATLNGRPLQVSRTHLLLRSLLGTGFRFNPSTAAWHVGFYEQFLHHAQGVRRAGSAALDLCYVAAGRLDGFWEFGLFQWDMAAALVVVSEAGGTVTAPDGSPLNGWGNDIVASNGFIHDQMLAVLRSRLVKESTQGSGRS